MKKVSLILLLVILASVALMAAAPLKLVRLTFINKSGHVIYIKLEGKSEGNFYYLTVPEGSKEASTETTFTVVADVYDRTMWYGPGGLCEGGSNSGELWAIKHAKFVFTPCGQPAPSNGEPTWGEKIVYYKWVEGDDPWNEGGSCSVSIKTSTEKSPDGSCYFLWKY
jgi:hypothetical protein